MLRQKMGVISVKTTGRGFYEVTEQVEDLVSAFNIHVGLATLHVRHTSASLIIQENADPDVRGDFERFFARLIPDGDSIFKHTCEGKDDMSAHIRSALTAVNLSIPISNAKLTLGTWQGIYLWEHRTHPHQREITIHLLGE